MANDKCAERSDVVNIFGQFDWKWIKMTKWTKVFLSVTVTCAILLWVPDRILNFFSLDGFTRHNRCVTTSGRVVGVMFVFCLSALFVCAGDQLAKFIRGLWQKRQETLQWKGENARKKILALSKTAKKNVRAKFCYDRVIKLSETDPVYAELLNGMFIIVAKKSDRLGVVGCELSPWVYDCLRQYPSLVQELPEFEDWEIF